MASSTSTKHIRLAECKNFALSSCQVSPARKLINTGKEAIELEPRVMQVLVALWEASPDPVSRDELLCRCWNNSVVGDDAIQRCISALRKALTKVPGASIKTITRVGYLLLEQKAVDTVEARPSFDIPSDLPVLGVKKFSCISENAQQHLFAELLSDDIVCALAIHRDAHVVDLSQSQDQACDYVLRGNIREQNDGHQIRLRLEHASSAAIIWAHSSDLDLKHKSPNEDLVIDLSSRTMGALMKHVTHQLVQNQEIQSAWAYVIRANAAFERLNLPNLEIATNHARKALEIDSSYGAAHAILANALAATYEFQGGDYGGMRELALQARQHCDLAMSFDQDNASVLSLVGNALGMVTRPAQGMLILERAIELTPTHYSAHIYKARQHLYREEPELALESIQQHERFAPRYPHTYWATYIKAVATFMAGDIAGADKLVDLAATMKPEYPFLWIGKMVTASVLGKQEAALAAAQKLKQIDGEESLELQLARIQHGYANNIDVSSQIELVKTAWC